MSHDDLEMHLENLRTALHSPVRNARDVAHAVRGLLEFLLAELNNTDANCQEASYGVARIVFDRPGAAALKSLPRPLADIVFDIAGQLHDVHSAPQIARNFSSTPEQLLERLGHVEGTL